MQFPITIGLHRSHFLDGAIGLVLVLVSVAAWAFPGQIAIRLTLLALGIFLAILAWQQLKPKLRALRLERNGELSAKQVSAEDFLPVEILPGASVHPWLTVLRLKMSDQTVMPLIVAVDSINATDFRRLRVFLRWRISADLAATSED